MVSNILDNFEDIDSDEQSMFINLNIRNRRQKILHNISFETDVFDIYNPSYSSDSSSSGSYTTSSIASSSSNSIEQQIQGDMSSESQRSSKQNTVSKLMEKDLEYNSENGRSSLSSIHRSIQEAPTQELSLKQSDKMTESMETGGCQPKEL